MFEGDVCSPLCVGCAVRTSFAALGLDAGVGWDATDLESGSYSTVGVRSRGELNLFVCSGISLKVWGIPELVLVARIRRPGGYP